MRLYLNRFSKLLIVHYFHSGLGIDIRHRPFYVSRRLKLGIGIWPIEILPFSEDLFEMFKRIHLDAIASPSGRY